MQDRNSSRDDRLKAALRENLKRRKAQARARKDEPKQAEREADSPAKAGREDV